MQAMGVRCGMKLKGESAKNRTIFAIDHNAFNDLCNPEACYWLGLLLADGCMSFQKRSKSWVCHLGSVDKEMIEGFKLFLKAENSICQYLPRRGKMFFSMRITHVKLCDRLRSLGMIPRKSLTLLFPESVPSQNISHFIRGYFDGDGCISIQKGKRTNQLHFHIVGSQNLIQSVQGHLVSQAGISKTKLVRTANVWNIHSKKREDIDKIRRYLYRDANTYLMRKKRIFETELIQNRTGYSSSRIGVSYRPLKNRWRATYRLEGNRKERIFQTESDAIKFLNSLSVC